MDIGLLIQWVAFTVVVFSILFQLALIMGTLTQAVPVQKNSVDSFDNIKVAIFVAARDEEGRLPGCLASLDALDYPKEFLDIFVADDNSTDNTSKVIHDWVGNCENRHPFFLSNEPEEGVNGKASALAKMTERAQAELFLFTDADCKVPPTWVKSMVSAYQEKHGMVIGVTRVEGEDCFSRLQAMDWLLHLGVIKQLADRGYSLTAMGNNMLVGSGPLESVGGFKSVEQSVTEDLALCQRLYNKGYWPFHLVGSENLVITKPEAGWLDLLHQRKRWAVGAMQLPILWKAILFVQSAFFPAVVAVLMLHHWVGISLWLTKFLLQSIFLYKFSRSTETIFRKTDFFIFEWYYLLTTCATVVYYFWPSKVRWKKRIF